MTKQTKDSLKAKPSQSAMEQTLSEHFMDYLAKARETVKLNFSNGHDVDSEVAIFTYHILNEFDKYRTRVDAN